MSSKSAAPRALRTGNARARAVWALLRVELDGAFAAPALASALEQAPALAPADRGLATELVYGVLRTTPALDARLSRHATRAGSLEKLDAFSRMALRVAAYQILALDRIPPRAAVHDAVESLKRFRSPGLAGFANALLRKLAAERTEPLPADARVALALESVPHEVSAQIAAGLGGSFEDAHAVLRAAFARPWSIGLRANATRLDRTALASALATELPPGAALAEGAVSPLALLLTGGGSDATRTRAYEAGLFAVQEEGAQCVALASGARPGMRVLDACAGRGGKTGALAEMMAGRGVLHAVDLYPEKVARIVHELTRLGLATEALTFESAAVDLSRGMGSLAERVPEGGYDLVVVDAPCSGLGTIARRPDILARREPLAVHSDDAEDGAAGATEAAAGASVAAAAGTRAMPLPALQRAILDRVAPLVRPGGTLVYAVCTLTHEEGPGAVAAFRAKHPGFVPAEGYAEVPARLRSSAVILRPDTDGTDGFMVFRLRRST